MQESTDQRPNKPESGPVDDFDAIVRNNQRWLRGYFRSRLSDWAAADDLAQDVFVTAFLKIRSYRGDSTIESWLRGIAHNHLRNHIRKHREQALGGSEELQALLDQTCDQWQSEMPSSVVLDALAACMDRLPIAARDLLDSRYVQGKSVREIEKETGKGYSALTMQFHRLREQLAECIMSKTGGQKA
jgi:RNA polymerase sigma-70 factor